MFLLKAKNNAGETLYYMNVICVTGQEEFAEKFDTREQAEAKQDHFRSMFFYETPQIDIVEV